MASPAPSKSQPQPLHNFPLSHLKWSTKHSRVRSSPNSRLSSASPHRSPTPLRHSSPAPSGEDSPIPDGAADKKPVIGAPSAEGDPSRPLLIKIRPNSGKAADEEKGKAEVGEEGGLADDEPKVWNLRPRKPIRKSLNLSGAYKNVAEGSSMPETRSQSPAMKSPTSKNKSEASKKDKEKKTKTNNFSLTLSRPEIEEDIYSLFGTKLPRRPKKRQKAAQRILDNLYPGAWLSTVTPDSYKVSEHPGKA